jgi:hypothetical protein
MAYTEMLAIWTGISGLPGYTKMRFFGELTAVADLDAAAANFRTWLAAAAAQVPSGVSIQVQGSASLHADDGLLTGELPIATPPAVVTGAGSGNYAAPAGALVRWITSGINGGHKVEGRTYIVPLSGGGLETNGTLANAYRTGLLAASIVFANSSPSPAVNSRAYPSNPLRGNQTHEINNAIVPDKAVILRSRRD